MRFRLFLSCVAGLLGSLAISAKADIQLAHVTNNVVDSGSCTIVGVNGGYGWLSNKVTCGSDVVYITNISGTGGVCQLQVTGDYYVNGGCVNTNTNSYTLYKRVAVPPPPPVFLTTITNGTTSSSASCTVEPAGGMGYGNYTYVGYRVNCSGSLISVTFTQNNLNGSCSLSNAPAGYVFSGGCSSYSIYKNQ